MKNTVNLYQGYRAAKGEIQVSHVNTVNLYQADRAAKGEIQVSHVNTVNQCTKQIEQPKEKYK